MKIYKVYLEVHGDERTMAHVLELPGCFKKGESKNRTLIEVPETICEYFLWLHKNGKTITPESFEIKVEEETFGDAAMESGDRAPLFTPEKSPPNEKEVKRFFQLMTF